VESIASKSPEYWRNKIIKRHLEGTAIPNFCKKFGLYEYTKGNMAISLAGPDLKSPYSTYVGDVSKYNCNILIPVERDLYIYNIWASQILELNKANLKREIDLYNFWAYQKSELQKAVLNNNNIVVPHFGDIANMFKSDHSFTEAVEGYKNPLAILDIDGTADVSNMLVLVKQIMDSFNFGCVSVDKLTNMFALIVTASRRTCRGPLGTQRAVEDLDRYLNQYVDFANLVHVGMQVYSEPVQGSTQMVTTVYLFKKISDLSEKKLYQGPKEALTEHRTAFDEKRFTEFQTLL